MRKIVIAALLAMPLAAPAEQQQQSTTRAEPGFHQRLYERYCEKLREGPEEYVQFVHRMKTIHGFAIADFAPEHRGDPVVADCGVARDRVAAVHRLVRGES